MERGFFFSFILSLHRRSLNYLSLSSGGFEWDLFDLVKQLERGQGPPPPPRAQGPHATTHLAGTLIRGSPAINFKWTRLASEGWSAASRPRKKVKMACGNNSSEGCPSLLIWLHASFPWRRQMLVYTQSKLYICLQPGQVHRFTQLDSTVYLYPVRILTHRTHAVKSCDTGALWIITAVYS